MKVFIAIPCMEQVPVDFVKSLMKLKTPDGTSINWSVGSLIYSSRDNLAGQAIMEGSDYVLWLDSDMVFDSYLLRKLTLDDVDFVSGLYFRRKAPYHPVIYKSLGDETQEYLDYPEGLFEIEACGFGGVLMKTSMLKDIIDKERNAFAPITGYGEDISFCIRAKRNGYKLWCDSRVKMGHITKIIADEKMFKLNKK